MKDSDSLNIFEKFVHELASTFGTGDENIAGGIRSRLETFEFPLYLVKAQLSIKLVQKRRELQVFPLAVSRMQGTFGSRKQSLGPLFS